MVPKRLRRLETLEDGRGTKVYVARSFRSRLVGLALLRELPRGSALLIPCCSAVHTVGMRFALEIRFLDAQTNVIRAESDVEPNRMLREPGAAAVLEWRSEPEPAGPEREAEPEPRPVRRRRPATAAGSPAPRAPGPRSR